MLAPSNRGGKLHLGRSTQRRVAKARFDALVLPG